MISKLDLSLKEAEIYCFAFQISGCVKEIALVISRCPEICKACNAGFSCSQCYNTILA